jgi:hypothetical protein
MSNNIERYSPEWNEALRRFVDAGQRLLADRHDRAALAEFSEAAKKLGFVVPPKPIPVTDLKPSGDPDTWVYKGDTTPRAFPITMVVT